MDDDTRSARAYVIAEDGARSTFGEFVDQRQRASSKPVSALAKAAKISRANYYLLRGDDQRPTLQTAIALLAALGLRTEVPAEGDDLSIDLRVYDGDARYDLLFEWSEDDRARARDRFLSSAGLGLGAVGLAGLGAAGGVAAVGVAGAVGALAVPFAGPVAVSVMLAARQIKQAREQQRRRPQSESLQEPAQAREDLLEDFKSAAEGMSTEDLEALLAAMKALRDSSSSD